MTYLWLEECPRCAVLGAELCDVCAALVLLSEQSGGAGRTRAERGTDGAPATQAAPRAGRSS